MKEKKVDVYEVQSKVKNDFDTRYTYGRFSTLEKAQDYINNSKLKQHLEIAHWTSDNYHGELL